MKSKAFPLGTALLCSALFLLSTQPLKALVFIGAPAGTMGVADGIGIGDGTRAYAFITPQHFVFSHNGPPGDIEGINWVDAQWLSQSPGLPVGTYGFGIGELAAPVPGIQPLPIAFSPIIGDYLGLDLRVLGNNGNNYGTQQVQPNLITALTNDRPPPNDTPPTLNVPVIGSVNTYTNDLWLFVDVRPGTLPNDPGKAFLAPGDSSGALIADFGGGVLGLLGTANLLVDAENPRQSVTSQWTDIDMNVYNLVPWYLPQIIDYINARNLVNNTDYQVNVLLFGNAIPEPTRALTLAFGTMLLLIRRRR